MTDSVFAVIIATAAIGVWLNKRGMHNRQDE